MPSVSKQRATKKKKSTVKKRGGILDKIQPIGFDDDEGISINIYGKSGSGKTTLWATFPAPILCLIVSGGKRSGELRSVDTPENRKRIKSIHIEKTSDLTDIIKHQEETGEFATIVLDHASGLQDLKLKEILDIDELPAQMGWGIASQQDWGQCALQMKESLRALLNLKCNRVIIAQEREFSNNSDTDSIIAPYVGSALTPSVAAWLEPACDYVVQTFKRAKMITTTKKVGGKTLKITERGKGVEYCLRVGPDEVYNTKFRVPGGVGEDVIIDPTYNKIENLIKGK